jgi:hypothetical protein
MEPRTGSRVGDVDALGAEVPEDDAYEDELATELAEQRDDRPLDLVAPEDDAVEQRIPADPRTRESSWPADRPEVFDQADEADLLEQSFVVADEDDEEA